MVLEYVSTLPPKSQENVGKYTSTMVLIWDGWKTQQNGDFYMEFHI